MIFHFLLHEIFHGYDKKKRGIVTWGYKFMPQVKLPFETNVAMKWSPKKQTSCITWEIIKCCYLLNKCQMNARKMFNL